jgi:hypothetical protein
MRHRKLHEALAAGNGPPPRREPAPVRDCEHCGRPTTGNPFCQRCQDAYDRLIRDLGLDEPELPGQESDPDLVAALGMSIVAVRMEREREEFDAANEGDRFDPR